MAGLADGEFTMPGLFDDAAATTDPVNPPSGCRFHTRCPEARETCRRETPPEYQHDRQRVRCFREDEDHEYWSSPELADEDERTPAETD